MSLVEENACTFGVHTVISACGSVLENACILVHAWWASVRLYNCFVMDWRFCVICGGGGV